MITDQWCSCFSKKQAITHWQLISCSCLLLKANIPDAVEKLIVQSAAYDAKTTKAILIKETTGNLEIVVKFQEGRGPIVKEHNGSDNGSLNFLLGKYNCCTGKSLLEGTENVGWKQNTRRVKYRMCASSFAYLCPSQKQQPKMETGYTAWRTLEDVRGWRLHILTQKKSWMESKVFQAGKLPFNAARKS